MNDKPDFDKWAEDIVDINSEGLCGETYKLIGSISKNLARAWEQGYRYAVRNDWWREQDSCLQEEPCNHDFQEMNPYCFHPGESSLLVCKKCGKRKK